IAKDLLLCVVGDRVGGVYCRLVVQRARRGEWLARHRRPELQDKNMFTLRQGNAWNKTQQQHNSQQALEHGLLQRPGRTPSRCGTIIHPTAPRFNRIAEVLSVILSVMITRRLLFRPSAPSNLIQLSRALAKRIEESRHD